MKEIFFILLFFITYSIITSNIPEVSLITRKSINLNTSSAYNYFYMNSSMNISSNIEFCLSANKFKINKPSYCFLQDAPNIDSLVNNCDFIELSPYRIHILSSNLKTYYYRIYIKNKYILMKYSGNILSSNPSLTAQSLDISNNNSSKISLPAALIVFIVIGALAFIIILIVFIVTICKNGGLVFHHQLGGYRFKSNYSRPLMRGYRKAHRFRGHRCHH